MKYLAQCVKKYGLILLLFTTHSAFADAIGSPDYLQLIWKDTQSILQGINNIPSYLSDITEMAQSWLKPDDSSATANNQSLFNTLGQAPNPNLGFTAQLTKNFLSGGTNASLPADANDYSFTTLIGSPLQKPDPRQSSANPPNPIQNYIQNASGSNLTFTPPVKGLLGANALALKQYQGLYSTVAAIQSYNNYILNAFNGELNQENTMSSLVSQATDSGWLTQVAAQELGKVLREILLYDSQSYVLLTRLYQTEQRQLAATAMTNSLLIALNQGIAQIASRQAMGPAA